MHHQHIISASSVHHQWGLFHFVYGAYPQHILLHFPTKLLHLPIKFASFPQQIASSPQQFASFSQQIALLVPKASEASEGDFLFLQELYVSW